MIGFLLPVAYQASIKNAEKTEFSVFKGKQKKKSSDKKSRKKKGSKKKSERSSDRIYTSARGCTYNGSRLYVGSRGGCYYYSGSSKVYVDRSYCSGCR